MKRLTIFLLCIVLFYSCSRNNDKNIEPNFPADFYKSRNTLIEKISQFKRQVSNAKNCTISIEIINDNYQNVFSIEDTIVSISKLNCLDIKSTDYIGVFNFFDNRIALFDNKKLSLPYLYPNELNYIPIEQLKCDYEKLQLKLVFIYSNGILNEWN